MSPTAWEQSVYGEKVRILKRTKEYDVYHYQNEDGDVVLTSYPVFEGIRLIYNDVHTRSISVMVNPPAGMFEINHCLEGRIECEMNNGCHFYVAKGDLSISRKLGRTQGSYFPVSHYHGVSICIDGAEAQKEVNQFLGAGVLDLQNLMEQFCGEEGFFVMRARETITYLFMQLYHVPNQIKREFFRLKVMEVLLYLSTFMKEEKEVPEYFTKGQVEKVKEIEHLVSSNLQESFTLEELSKQFKMSVTTMKKCFKGVYGMTIGAYGREMKMRGAAKLLQTTDMTILQVANCVGYENGSKFASAFRQIIGLTPKQFRQSECLIGAKYDRME